MPIAGRLLKSNARITSTEFYNALSATLRGSSVLDGGTHPRVGLAVSGGVDSMALATLCRDLSTARPALGLQFKALIVDHNVREESASEASEVATILQNMGLSPTVLRLRWPEGSDPLKSANFETAARKLRFQVLGRACVQEGIRSLLFAHHADDQAETVLMRLQNRQRGIGLQGIKRAGVLPECFGIYGASQSGSPHRDVEPEPRQRSGSGPKPDARMLDYEGGGVMVYRPLLDFNKERLVATCVESGTQWSEDCTNNDVSLTPRNAIRYLLQNDRLPKALRKSSLLTVSESMLQRELKRAGKVNWVLGRCEFLMFDTRTGSLVIRFPKKIPKDREETSKVNPDLARAEEWSVAANLVNRVATLVTSLEAINTTSLHAATSRVFPDLSAQEGEQEIDRVVVANVDLRRIFWPLTHDPPELAPDAITDLDPDHVWVLTRSMYRSGGKEDPIITIPNINKGMSHHIGTPFVNDKGAVSPSDLSKDGEEDPGWSPWHLWDGRFWIRVMNRMGRPVTIRPLRPTDVKPFRLSLRREHRNQLDDMLVRVAPHYVRFTLPAISTSKNDRVLALPTLRIVMENELDGRGLLWQIRYKMVDLDMIR